MTLESTTVINPVERVFNSDISPSKCAAKNETLKASMGSFCNSACTCHL
jgi:hypothetical protein